MIAAGTQDFFNIFIWNVQTGKLLDIISGHEGPISSLSFAPNSTVLASGSWDQNVMIWDVLKPKEPRVNLDII